MSLTINVDTYISLNDAKAYVTAYYTSTDPLRLIWDSLSDTDKEAILRQAFVAINELPYTGRPVSVSIPFPRAVNYEATDLANVQHAQVDQALAISDTASRSDEQQREKMRRSGLSSIKIGDLEEHYFGYAGASNKNYFGLCEIAYKKLSKWLTGGYEICSSIRPHYGHR